ncbi:MAG: hypothetical protein PVF83_06655 [Anaerolineales bacterium]
MPRQSLADAPTGTLITGTEMHGNVETVAAVRGKVLPTPLR